jgi:hypothetical protein
MADTHMAECADFSTDLHQPEQWTSDVPKLWLGFSYKEGKGPFRSEGMEAVLFRQVW